MNNILMRLRQTCNHPYLLPGQEPEVRVLAGCCSFLVSCSLVYQ
jgi:SNF2 family DNA or RNA helicase